LVVGAAIAARSRADVVKNQVLRVWGGSALGALTTRQR
jgi:hypothetical protein